MTDRYPVQGCPVAVKSCDHLYMKNGKLTLLEINQRQAILMQKHRDRELAQGTDLPNHLIDLKWIRLYAKRFREDMVRLGLAAQCK